jgi:hypothetical protein
MNRDAPQWECSDCGWENNIKKRECRNATCNAWRPKALAPKRKGDWECCGEVQFASRKKCRKCNKEKSGGTVEANSSSPPAVVPFRHGDWLCSQCQDHQFASRTQCRKCGTSRPVRETADGEEINPCIICYERERNVAFLHGNEGHFICCYECAQDCQTCPMCRGRVEKIIKIY